MLQLLLVIAAIKWTFVVGLEISTVVGNGIANSTGDGGAPLLATISLPKGIWGDTAGNLHISEAAKCRVRKLSANTNIMSTIIGNGLQGTGIDNQMATSSTIRTPIAVFGDSLNSKLYVCDSVNSRVRMLTFSTGIITNFAGTGVIDPLLAFDGNLGPASSATVINPYGLAVDSTGSVYIAENNGHKIRKVTAADGIISVIAGTGTGQYTGDSGPSSSASVFGPSQIYLDSAATRLYIADSKNYVIRVINMQSSGMIITRFAGTGVSGSSSATGVATSTALNSLGVYGDSDGTVYFSDQGGDRILQVLSGSTIRSSVAGGQTSSDSTLANGDGGPPTAARFQMPNRLFVDTTGSVFICDGNNNKIRKLYNFSPTSQPSTQPTSHPSIQPTSQPSGDPSMQPSGQPSGQPSQAPTSDPGELLFTYTSPQVQSFAVPLSVYSMTVIVYAASAQNSVKGAWNSYGGKGAKVVSSFVVSPFDVFYVICGSQTGFNGGGSGYAYESKPGGGATDIRTNASDITTRIVVAGGGGGSAGWCGADGGDGGFNGTAGMPEVNTGYCTGGSFPATGGTQSSGGRPGDQGGTAGTLGQGGSGLNDGTGGGGGYYGGGGAYYAGGGGGSSHSADPNAVYTTGANIGNGYAVVTFHFTYPSGQPSSQPSGNPSTQPSRQPSGCPSSQPSRVPSAQPSIQPVDDPSIHPSQRPSIQPTCHPSGAPSSQPNSHPSQQPAANPTIQPSRQPSGHPSTQPSTQPSDQPSVRPSVQPSAKPSSQPSSRPSIQPSLIPTCQPLVHPSRQPSTRPSTQPTGRPSMQPSCQPSSQPSERPSTQPSSRPSSQPTVRPSIQPSSQPSSRPTDQPSSRPSCQPTNRPSIQPSNVPTSQPTSRPSHRPSSQPSNGPSTQPSVSPSSQPSIRPSCQPVSRPSSQPSLDPSTQPSENPSGMPSKQPLSGPSCQPSTRPSARPSCESVCPTLRPSDSPTRTPSVAPTAVPTILPTASPSMAPSVAPSLAPRLAPSTSPTETPSTSPSAIPSEGPSVDPTAVPSIAPTIVPTMSPSVAPSRDPSRIPSATPSVTPSVPPSAGPSTFGPSVTSSVFPSTVPSVIPSISPSESPRVFSSIRPSVIPSMMPSVTPSVIPSEVPSVAAAPFSPSVPPSLSPTATPMLPSSQPSSMPSLQSSALPSGQPTSHPSGRPSSQPFSHPSVQPSAAYTGGPRPTWLPTTTAAPTRSYAASLPSQRGFSVIRSMNDTQFKIVLPFLHTNAPLATNEDFADIHVGVNVTHGVNHVLIGGRSLQSLWSDSPLGSSPFVYHIAPAVGYDFSGRSASNAGDVNGDGHDDLIIGVPYASRCYVLFGTKHGFVNMTEGFTIFGAQPSDLTGWSVTSAGDLNDDTYADVIIGAPNVGLGGAVYVVYGHSDGHNVYLDELDAYQGFVVFGASVGDCLGVSVSGAGDVNGDGIDDVVIGALLSAQLFAGAVYVLFGQSRDNVSIKSLSDGWTLRGAPWSYFGYSVSAAGDVNGDGLSDVLVGSVGRRDSSMIGDEVAYVVFGNNATSGLVSDIITLTSSQSVMISGGGVVVSGVGDINGDGFDDIMIGNDYGFDSGGGFVVTYPTTLPPTTPTARPSVVSTVKPTVRTVKPSRAPSERPSQLPTRCPVSPSTRPTTPTMGPTPSPTGPSMCPSVIPSSPSSVPSSPPSLLTTSPSVAVTQFYTAEPTEQPITDFLSLSPTYKLTLSPSVAPSAVPSKAPSRPPTFLPSVMTRVTRQPSTARPTTTASPSALTTLNITLTSGGSYAQVFGRVHYFINATDTVRIVKPAMRNSASSYIYSISPNPKTLFVIEQFDNHTDVIDLVAFDTIPKFSSLNITRGSVVITLPHRQVIRILNLQPQDVSRSNFLFYIPTNATQVDPVMIANEHESIKSQLIILSSVSGAVLLFLIWMCFSSRSPCGSYLKRNRRQRKTLYESPVVVLTNMDSDTSFVSFGSSTSSGSGSSKQSSSATSHSSFAERLGHFLHLSQSSSSSRGGDGGGESKSSVELCHCANIFCHRQHFHAISSGSQDASRTNSLDEDSVSTSDDSSSSDDTSSLAKHGSQQLERGVNVGNSMNRIRLSSEALSDYSSLSDDDEATTVSASRKMKQHDNLSIEHNATEPNGSHRLSTRLPSKTRSQSCEQQHSDPEGGEDDSCSSDYNSVILSSDDENE